MNRGSRTGEVVDLVDLEVYRESDVVPHKFEAGVVQQMADIRLAAGEEVIQADHVVLVLEQTLAKVRSEKAAAAEATR